ncbi:hypothetical protein H113_01293 [Trichophyton rubrum MR1459]|uniref:Uncharacterized protein n=1 Tax=Trichophyton rubrum (strain ATCC MYA-4607 / CBS 118892) TaxID=559305 RepID=A0A080WJB1_TRIRC|nr:uncharacterized protein TERG_12582 [Trichophyton rubrum CBS 118892]EZF98980.1 hypothetical protein H113_01293 [Trichophyton rubrum MR1459]EZG10116.1 hypothetical protein H106_01090 [Trichophyton rubrum CBS 735.88]KFL62806.1 hypothetical protein TERG_12582 [Trichophyton rubrum CBS 118892]
MALPTCIPILPVMLSFRPWCECIPLLTLPRSVAIIPDMEWTLALSLLEAPPRFSTPATLCVDELLWSAPTTQPTCPLNILSGKLSRLPLKRDEGASARTDAFVSREFRRRRLDDDARVRTEALSVSRLFAVALE